MSSLAQNIANIANALKSTGPRTAEGLAASKFNALKHGLSGKQIVIGGEDPEQYDRARISFHEAYNPDGPIEVMMVEQIAQTWWKMQRAVRVEAQLVDELGEIAIFTDEKAMKKFALFLRHRTALDRSWRHAIGELKQLQRARAKARADAEATLQAQHPSAVGSVLQLAPHREKQAPEVAAPNHPAGAN